MQTIYPWIFSFTIVGIFVILQIIVNQLNGKKTTTEIR